ncbi:MAG: PHP-associated domain-containing protein [Dehalococcoidia bacterium]
MQYADLHVHGRLSKGFDFEPAAISRLRELANRRGLTGFGLTEHIHAKQFWEMHDYLRRRYAYRHGAYDVGGGYPMLSGCEVTVAEKVDFILLGELDQLERLDFAFSPSLSEGHFPAGIVFLEEARRRDLLVIAAHPFREGKELGRLPLGATLDRVAALEINGKDYRLDDAVAPLAATAGLPVSGGSDAHHPFQVGIRSTVIPGNELSLESVRAAFEAKRTRIDGKSYAPLVVDLCKGLKQAATIRSLAAAMAARCESQVGPTAARDIGTQGPARARACSKRF